MERDAARWEKRCDVQHKYQLAREKKTKYKSKMQGSQRVHTALEEAGTDVTNAVLFVHLSL